MRVRVALILCGTAALVIALGAIQAIGQPRPPDGAPPAGAGPRLVTRVRVIDGDSLDAYVDGKRTAIGLVGVNAPMGNTPCGKAATGVMWGLVKAGLKLEDDAAQTFDPRGRRMYRASLTDGRSVAQEMARRGLVRASGIGGERGQVESAMQSAVSGGVGCLWGGAPAPEPTPAPPSALGLLTSLLEIGTASAAPLRAAALPASFAEDVVIPGGANGLAFPTAFAFVPGGRIFVAEKNGMVRVHKQGALLATPLIDLQDRVNDHWDHGLLGIAVDPNFDSNGYVYLLYAYENNPDDYFGKKSGRLARYTVAGDVADKASELVLLGTVVGAGCESIPLADCIPSEYFSHSVGNVKFGPDGTLFVSMGDASSFNEVDDRALRAQSLDSLAGKILRIDPLTGQGVGSNPFATPDPGDGSLRDNRDKAWAYGLRNPYRFSLKPNTTTPFYGDVGWNNTEEVGVATPGANLGWPCYEGSGVQAGYASKPVCQTLYGQGSGAHTSPLFAWPHNFGGSCCGAAATGGVFLTGTAYPAQYQGAYFFADFIKEWIRYFNVTSDNELVPGTDAEFSSSGTDGPVDFAVGPEGNLYYLAINSNELRRIRYTGDGNRPPTAVISAAPTEGAAPLPVLFSSAGSFDADADPLTYQWNFGDGASSTDPNPQHTYTQLGVFTASVTVSDGRGGTATESTTIGVGSFRPMPTIATPTESLRYAINDLITFSGSATDPEDGALPASSLSWRLIARHCPGGTCHSHVIFDGVVGDNGSFTVPDHGDDNYFELVLTATDSFGLTGVAIIELHPQTVQVTLATIPPGQQVIYDGTAATAPLTRTTVPSSAHTIEAPTPAGYAFVGWSDGKAQQHGITAGSSDTTYTAEFRQLSLVTFDDKAGQNQNLNGQYPTGVIDWGTNQWYHSAPWGPFTTKSVSFRTASQTSATFTFINARKLVSLRALNGGGGSTTVTMSCNGQSKSQAISAGQVTTITTDFTSACTTVTVASTNGWDTNFDDLVHDVAAPPPPDTTPPTISGVQATNVSSTSATITWTTNEPADRQVEYGTTTAYGALAPTTPGTPLGTSHSVMLSGLTANTLYHYRVKSTDAAGNTATSADFTFTTAAVSTAQTVTFDDKSGQNQNLNGQYPSGVINWGSNQWYHSAPWGAFTTKSVSFRTASQTSTTFTFINPRKLVSLRALNGGGTSTSITVSCNGQTKTTALPAGQVTTITTGFTSPCTNVTVSSTNGWDTNFDDLVHDH